MQMILSENYKKRICELAGTNQAVVSPEEQNIINDILGTNQLNEGQNFNEVLKKVKSYAIKGLITTAILTSLLSNSAFSQEQKEQIKNSATTELSTAQQNVMETSEFVKMIKKEKYSTASSLPLSIIASKYASFKIFTQVGNTFTNANQLAFYNAGNPMRSFTFQKTLPNGQIQVLLAVPV